MYSIAKRKAAKERKQVILSLCLLVPLALLVFMAVFSGLLNMFWMG